MKTINILIFTLLVCFKMSGQIISPSFQSPEIPSSFEFSKYDQIPVGEYTGVPSIGIPLYSISVDEVSIPIALQYHAGGIRVSEEASYVGLGWNLNFGQITQVINGKNDLINHDKERLIYQNSPMLSEWPIASTHHLFDNAPSNICNLPNPVFTASTPQSTNALFIASNEHFPFTNKSYCYDLFYPPNSNSSDIDLEPDIFKVNFFEHSFSFIYSFNGDYFNDNQIVVLDKKGYSVKRIAVDNYVSEWEIRTPDGTTYYFSEQDNVLTTSTTKNDQYTYDRLKSDYGSSLGGQNTSRTWKLTKVITVRNNNIIFEYENHGIISSDRFDDRQRYFKNIDYLGARMAIKGFLGILPFNGTAIDNTNNETVVHTTYSTSEKANYVKRIIFPAGEVNFSYSTRLDAVSDKKIDEIKVKNKYQQTIKKFNFNYAYFIADQSGETLSSSSGMTNLYRLRLNSLIEEGKGSYDFTYNLEKLPKKNSTAVDYWGFYNGEISNNSLAPNPARIGYANIGNNGNNKSALLNFAKAGVLEKIKFPTGGEITYNYGLNEFSNNSYYTSLPNHNGTIGSSVKGFGLRIQNIKILDKNIVQKETEYTYSDGKAITPLSLRSFYPIQISGEYNNIYGTYKIDIYDFFASNYFKSNSLGSINTVGYDMVTVKNIGDNDQGKTVYNFSNNVDIKPLPTISLNNDATYGNLPLPTLQDYNSVENGKLLSESVFNNIGDVILKKEYSYSTKKSNIYYGTSISGFRYLVSTGDIYENIAIPQYLVGYYPVFLKQSLLSSEKTTQFFDAGNVISNTNYTYNSDRLLTEVKNSDNIGNVIKKEITTYSIQSTHINKNILNLPNNKSIYTNGRIKATYKYNYTEANNITLLASLQILPMGNPNPSLTKSIFYDKYDSEGNLLEFHDQDNIYTAIIWGYNKQYPIAKIESARYSEVLSQVSNLQSKSDLDNDRTIGSTGNEGALRNALESLRTSFPLTMVSTYTYDPLIGLTSFTDPKGYTLYYDYDAFNRLEQVKDTNGSIISEMEYNYKQ